MKNLVIVLGIVMSQLSLADSLCKDFRAEYEAETESKKLVVLKSVSAKGTKLPKLTETEKFMAQTAILANGSEALDIDAALEAFFLGNGDNGEGSITYSNLTRTVNNKVKVTEVAQAKFYAGGNPVGALFQIVRMQDGAVLATLIGMNSDDSISCISYN